MSINGVAAYAQAARVTSPIPAQPAEVGALQPLPQSHGGGFGVIEDLVSLSPEAMALMNGGGPEPAVPPPAEDDASDDDADTPAVSDPFRAYRGADGELSLEAMAQIEMLPPRLRDAGRLMRAAASLRDEIAAAEKDPATDPKTLKGLRDEYDATMGALWEELDKLGLTKKMKEGDISLEDLVRSGLNGLSALAEEPGEGPPERLGVAGVKELPGEGGDAKRADDGALR